MARAAACWALAATVATGSPVEAQSTRDAASATDAVKARFANAQKLFKDGHYADALPVFRDLADSTRSPNARLYVGLCLQELGKFVEAHKAFSAVVRDVNEHSDEKYQTTREAAVEHLAILNVRLGRVIIALAEAPPPSFAVKLDGAPIDEKTLGSSIVVDPGAHKIEATASGAAPLLRDVTLEA